MLLSGCAAPIKQDYRRETLPPISAISYRNASSQAAFNWPVSGKIISGFGDRGRREAKNKGIDIAARKGAVIRASKGGRVIFSADTLKGFRKTIILDHGDGYMTLYSYNSELLKTEGANVRGGEPIAMAGTSGTDDEVALHFEIRRAGRPLDPLKYLRNLKE